MNNHGSHPPSPTATASVQVVVRLRPLNEKEKSHGTLPVVSASTNEKTVTVIKGQGSRQVKASYKFDNVFTAFSTQEEVFEATLQPVIRDVLMGFESTVFAYGQTGTGKTHTMEGDLSKPELHGVIPRSAAAIFEALERPDYVEKSICVSFLEIYNEDLCDLLADSGAKKAKLDIMEGKNGPFCRGLSETKVNTAEEVLTLMRKAQNHRQVGETSMNKQSSRSHCIFTLKVLAKRRIGDGSLLEVNGKLHCVDLAGSECAKSADLDKGSDDQQAARERERMNINRSLLTLGRVVSMLKEQSQGKKNKAARIPYRDSKLTRILQESLGGRCKTCLIATVSPSITAVEESMSTLNYAQAANGIINKPVTSSLMTTHAGSMATTGDKKGPGGDAFGTVEHWNEMECRLQYMQSQVEEAQQALARKHLQQQELMEKAEASEAARLAAVAAKEEICRQKDILETENKGHVADKRRISENLARTEQTLMETLALLQATRETESRLTIEAKNLLECLCKSTEDGDALYQALIKNHDDKVALKDATRSFTNYTVAILQETAITLESLGSEHDENSAKLLAATSNHTKSQECILNEHAGLVNNMNKNIHAAIVSLRENMVGNNGIVASVNDTTMQIGDISTKLRGLSSSYHQETISAIKNLCDRLEDAMATLQDMESKYIESSECMVKNLGKDVMECKTNVDLMISSMCATLTDAQEGRRKSLEKVRGMIEGWKSKSIDYAKGIGNVSTVQATNIESFIEDYVLESKRHNDVLTALLQQREYLDNQGKDHNGKLETQHVMLRAQRDAMADSCRQANELCDHVMSKIVNGVRDLVQKEMATIVMHQETTLNKMSSSHEKLVKNIEDISGSFRNTIDRIGLSNETMKVHSTALLKNDENALNILCSSKDVLEKIHSDSMQQEQNHCYLGKSISDEFATSESVDQCQLDEMNKLLKEQGRIHEDNLMSCILSNASVRSNELCIKAREAIEFARTEMVEKTKGELECSFKKHTSSFASNVHGYLDKIHETTRLQTQTIDKFAQVHLSNLDKVSKDNEETSSVLSTGITTQVKSLLEYNEETSKCLVTSKATVKELVGICSANNASTVKSLNEFSIDVVKADEETPDVPERNILQYSDELSATPADHIILQKVAAGLTAGVSDGSSSVPYTEGGNENDSLMEVDTNNGLTRPVLHEKTNEKRVGGFDGSMDIHKRRPQGCPSRNTHKAKRARECK